MKKIFALIMAVCLAVLCFAGCGNDVNPSKKVKVIDVPLSSEEYAFVVSKKDTDFLKQINDFLKEIKEDGTFDDVCNNYFGDGKPNKFKSAELDTSKKQIIVATATGFEPFEMVDENKNYYGIDLEIAKLLGDKLGMEVVIKNMDFDAVVNSVQSGICNIGMSGLSVTPERKKVVQFTDSYYNASQVVVVNKENKDFDKCKKAEDVEKILKGYDESNKVGCQSGTTGELYIKGSKDNGFAGLKAKASPYKFAALAVTAMQQGQVECVIIDNGPAKAITNKVNGGK